MYCKDCKNYEKGFDGKPGTCKLTVANIWESFDELKKNGFGFSVENYETDTSVLYVGEEFGCVNFK